MKYFIIAGEQSGDLHGSNLIRELIVADINAEVQCWGGDLMESAGATLLVQDEGPGIPADLREKVFERFYQISQGDSREYGGLGVGLTIARAVFRNLGGTVEMLDSPKGCRLRAYLPERSQGDIVYE